MCRLQKKLYGLKQECQKWYKKFGSFMQNHRYNRCHLESFCSLKWLDDDSYIILYLYVDDILVARSNVDHIKGLKCHLAHTFAMRIWG